MTFSLSAVDHVRMPQPFAKGIVAPADWPANEPFDSFRAYEAGFDVEANENGGFTIGYALHNGKILMSLHGIGVDKPFNPEEGTTAVQREIQAYINGEEAMVAEAELTDFVFEGEDIPQGTYCEASGEFYYPDAEFPLMWRITKLFGESLIDQLFGMSHPGVAFTSSIERMGDNCILQFVRKDAEEEQQVELAEAA